MRLAGKRIALLSSWLSPRNGGVWTAVLAQAAMLRSAGATPVLVGLADRAGSDDQAYDFECLRVPGIGPESIGFAPRLTRVLHEANFDLLHLHGIWHYPSLAAAKWAEETGKPYLVSPHGMLDPWIVRRNRWKKHLGELAFERRNWAAASAFHALTEKEAEDIGHHALDKPRCVIPNAAPPANAGVGSMPPSTLLYLGRLHAKKNLAALIEGWAEAERLGNLPKGAQLVIAGWGTDSETDALEKAIAGNTSIRFVGSVEGAAKRDLLATSRAVILPSLSEGLPMVVLEAWAAGRPVLLSRHCHLPQGFATGAALDCGTESADIALAITAAFGWEEQEWQERGEAGLVLARGEFAAETVQEEWVEVYRTLLGGRRNLD